MGGEQDNFAEPGSASNIAANGDSICPGVKADGLDCRLPARRPHSATARSRTKHAQPDHDVVARGVIMFGRAESVPFGSTKTQERLKTEVTLLKF